ANVLESAAIDVFQSPNRLVSNSRITTIFQQSAPPTARSSEMASRRQPQPVTISADSLDYTDQDRRARYLGNVKMVTQGTTMGSDRLDVHLSQGMAAPGSEVERIEADGRVRLSQPGRHGSGDRAEYFAGPGKVVLTGGPPILVDEQKGSTTGRRLTFYTRD